MDDVIPMQLADSIADLLHDESHSCFGHGLMFFEVFIELSICTEFEDDVDIDMIIKKPIHLDDVGMVDETLDFEFSDELLGDFLLLEQFLLDDFEGTDEVSLFLAC
jgi:hypothetical protein